MKKLKYLLLLIMLASITLLTAPYMIHSKESEYTIYLDNNKLDDVFTSYQEAYKKYQEIVSQDGVAEIKRDGKTVFIEDGIVVFPNVANKTTSYKDAFTKTSHYTTGAYGRDGGLISYNDVDNTIRFSYAGSEGIIDLNKIALESYQRNNVVNRYFIENGQLYHEYSYFSGSNVKTYYIVIGLAPSYLKTGTKYYGYDNHYFYKSYSDLILDLQENENIDYFARKHIRAINADTPYYNYYQLLSNRTYTTYSVSEIDNLIKDNTTAVSKLRNLGKEFIDKQNKYGANALLMLGVAINESGWGTSDYAINRNNLFGHAAYDSDPDGNASSYSSPAFSIYWHAYKYVSDGYMDPADSAGRYFGSSLGAKSSGMNVKYASDPYWGEKAARIGWLFHSYYPNHSDLYNYTIGLLNTTDEVNIRKDANTSSKVLFTTGVSNSSFTSIDYPFVIMDKVKGQSINGNDIWYKIRSDALLKNDRSGIYQSPKNEKYPEYYYNRDISYAYIHSSYVNIIFEGKNIENKLTFLPENEKEINFDEYLKVFDIAQNDEYLSGFYLNTKLSDIASKLTSQDKELKVSFKDANGKDIDLNTIVMTGQTMKLTVGNSSKEYTLVIKGDTDGNGIINDIDYVRVRKHLSVKEFPDYHLTGAYLQAANVKSDDDVNDIDYVRIRKHLSKKEFPDYSIDGAK